jgi:hypothetical protein
MNRSIKAIIALLAIAVVLSLLAFTQTSQPLNVNGSLINVPEGKAIWTQTYGGSADDRAFYALPVGSDFLVVGSTKSAGNGTTLMGWVLMLKSNGALIWNKTYVSGSGTEIRSVVAVSDGYLLVGNQFTTLEDENGYVAKINSSGDLEWQTVVGGAQIDKLFSGAAFGDGYVVSGLSYSYGSNASQAWAVKLDNAGSIVWNKVYNNGNVDCALRSSLATSDGGLVAAGYIDSGDGNYDFYLQKISADGNLVWNQTYGDSGSEKAYSIAAAPDGYILAGDITSNNSPTDACIVRVDSAGNFVWTRSVGGDDADSASYITQAQDGGYLVCGFTFSYGEGNRDFWLFSISDDGNVGFSCTYGNSAYQEAYTVLGAGDGKYVMFGWTDPPDRPDLVGHATYDFYIVKLSVAPDGPSMLTIGLSVATFGLLVAALALMIRLRRNKK